MTANLWAPFTLARECAKFMPEEGRFVVLSTANSRLVMGDPECRPIETDALREPFAAKGPEFEAAAHK
ncbi:hypothetical protein AC578_541 [Pseudocercospora eumusae]|uniref:Uncharacterized protein n=1 Tax=Pseudocercospora eumusae TaxID=321146 RepID=A0A139HYK0_9PEZI|nr:hypothetical protein AC578_541 [Pseudocercospora eumusae]